MPLHVSQTDHILVHYPVMYVSAPAKLTAYISYLASNTFTYTQNRHAQE